MCHTLELSNVGCCLVSCALCIEMLDFYKKNHVVWAEGTARAKAQRQGTQSDWERGDGRGSRGVGRQAGVLGFTWKAARRWHWCGSKYGPDRFCVSGTQPEILGQTDWDKLAEGHSSEAVTELLASDNET